MPTPTGPGPISALERRLNPPELSIDDKPNYGTYVTSSTGPIPKDGFSAEAVRRGEGDENPESNLYRQQSESVQRPICNFVETYYLHYNGGTLHRSAKAYCELIDRGGWMLLTIAGAASTAELGKIIAPMIDAGKVHAIACTGANIEEDVFRLVGHKDYIELPEYQQLSKQDDETLDEEGYPRVTDSAINEQKAMAKVEKVIEPWWSEAQVHHRRFFWHEPFYDVLTSGALEPEYQKDPSESWVMAAAKKNLPIIVPGCEDSSLGNHFQVGLRNQLYDPTLCKSGHEYMVWFSRWYQGAQKAREIGFFQLGGGIAGDCPICVVPLLTKDARLEAIKKWGYFSQITDATESYGGYSGAMPTEKISWGKLAPKTPAFCIHSDFTIAFPLVGGYVLGM